MKVRVSYINNKERYRTQLYTFRQISIQSIHDIVLLTKNKSTHIIWYPAHSMPSIQYKL